MRFFIIGNGFDLHHSFKTSWSNFENFYRKDDSESYQLLEDVFHPDRDGDAWKDIETSLANGNFELIYEEAQQSLSTDEDRDRRWHDWQANVLSLISKFEATKTSLDVWIANIEEKIKLSQSRQYFNFGSDDVFLTFNYTSTLETLYKVDPQRVLHIHGNRVFKSKIFGHSQLATHIEPEKVVYSEFSWISDEANCLFDMIPTIFRKDADQLVQKHKDFFEKIKQADEVLILGWSMGKQDWPYMEKICECLTQGTTLKVVYYRLDDTLKDIAPFDHKIKSKEIKVQFIPWSTVSEDGLD